jgi:large subunit ribosomal protein L22
MPHHRYSVEVEGPCARAYGRELRISRKHAEELCRAIKGMGLEESKKFLEGVVSGKTPVPFRRHSKKLGHRRGCRGAGRFPAKAAKEFLKLLQNAEANATYKGLAVEKLRIVHACAKKGMVIPGYLPRAFARATPFNQELTNVELVLKEVS